MPLAEKHLCLEKLNRLLLLLNDYEELNEQVKMLKSKSTKFNRDYIYKSEIKKITAKFNAKRSFKEPTAWSDFRTGETLYRTYDGRIVNSKGEEVSVAWWD